MFTEHVSAVRPAGSSGRRALRAGVIALAALVAMPACSTAPDREDIPAFRAEVTAAEKYFEDKVPGLRQQIANSAGYAVFPNVGQFGIIFVGGQFGRGSVKRGDGTQIGWGAIDTGNLGLQAGVRGFKMLVIFQDQATFNKFRDNQLTGSVNGVAVAADEAASATAPFNNGVVVYQGASSGLIAGVNVGLDYLRYRPLDQEP